MAKLLYQGQNISRAPKEKSAWTSPATVLTGDTSVTIYDSRIKSTSVIKKYVEPFSDGEILGVSNIQITDGQAVLTFSSAAKADTTIKLEIMDVDGFKEVTLWENPSPTGSTFPAQTVALSDNINNYNYLCFYYRYGADMVIDNDPMLVIIPVSNFKTSVDGNSVRHNILTIATKSASNYTWSRGVFYASDTSVKFSLSYPSNATGSENVSCMPLKITGLTELSQTKVRNIRTEKVLWVNNSASSSFSAQSVVLDDSWQNYNMLGIEFKAYYPYSTLAMMYIDVTNPNTMRNPAVHSGDSSTAYSIQAAMYSIWTNHYMRYVRLNNSATDGEYKVYFSSGFCLQSGPSTTYNEYDIPTKIIGIKEISTHKADIYGAAQDTIYYSTNGTDWTVVGQTDSNGYLANAVLPDTAFILKSSVAKNPEDLTADYTKAFNTDSNVLRFMPDNCLYWYGYMSSDAEETKPANGWTLYSGYTFVAPTYSTNKLTMTTVLISGGNTQCGIGSKNIVNNATRLCTITQGKTMDKTRYGELFSAANKTLVNDTELTNSAIAKSQKTISGSSYVAVMTNGARSIDVYALWYE